MTRPFVTAILVATLGLPVAGCGSSPPTHYYMLDAMPASSPSPTAAGMVVQVAAVHIPASLDRRGMVREIAPGSADISGQNRWVAPLGDMVQRVLTQDLAQRLAKGTVILPQQPAPANTHKVVVDILQFESNASGDVVFDGSWSLLHSSTETALATRHVHLRARAAADNFGAQAKAMSRILGSLADQIARAASG